MKTFVYIGTSLDGFIARENGDFDWLSKFADAEAFAAYDEFMSQIDAILIGRGTFEKVLEFPTWPYEKKVFVLSNGLKDVPVALREKVTILSMTPAEALEYLADQSFTGVYVDGGRVIQSFLKEDLIGEMTIARAPVLIGKGIPLFGHLPADLAFDHLRTIEYSNGLVRSYYRRSRAT